MYIKMIGSRDRVPIRRNACDCGAAAASHRVILGATMYGIASRHVERGTALPRTSVCSGRPPAKHINAMTRTPAHPPPINATNTHQKETIGSPLTSSSNQYRLAYSAGPRRDLEQRLALGATPGLLGCGYHTGIFFRRRLRTGLLPSRLGLQITLRYPTRMGLAPCRRPLVEGGPLEVVG